MTSLRGILTRSLLLATLGLSVAAGIALYFSMRSALLEQFDGGLAAKAHAIGSTLRIERTGKYEMDFADDSMKEFLPGKHAEYFQVIGPNRKTMELSSSLAGKDLIDPTGVDRERRVWDMTLPDGRSGRAMSYLTVPASEDEDRDEHATTHPAHAKAEPILVIVARGRGNVDEVLRALLTAIIIAAVVLICAAIFAVRYAIGRGLRPVNALAEQANRIGPETLDYRFDVNALPIELQPICLRLNDLLTRLDHAFKRERRLNADIAHELRTPIAELRALTEVAQRWPGDSRDTGTYFKDAHEIGLRMESMVETLLALGRSQTRKTNIRVERVEIAPLLHHAVEGLRDQIAAKELEVASMVSDGLIVETDQVMFRRIIENLLGNAAEYTPAHGKIECFARGENGRCTLRIANTNDSLTREDLSSMFEPFWRKDPARSGDLHAGLGLTLVAEYAKQLGITITPGLTDANRFEITLELPCAPAAVVVT